MNRIVDRVRALVRRRPRAAGGEITGPGPQLDSVSVWISNGLVSYDGGRTWQEVPRRR